MREAISELIGRHVATRRTNRGLTQEVLAGEAGISRQALSEIERGNAAPAWETLYNLAQALRCDPWELIPTLRQVRDL